MSSKKSLSKDRYITYVKNVAANVVIENSIKESYEEVAAVDISFDLYTAVIIFKEAKQSHIDELLEGVMDLMSARSYKVHKTACMKTIIVTNINYDTDWDRISV